MNIKTFFVLGIAIALTAVARGADNVHHGNLGSGGSLYFRAEPVNNFVADRNNINDYLDDKSSPNDIYYYVHLQGAKKEGSSVKKRLPLNLSIVIDRSGSMQGDKLNYTKEAVKYVINQLDSRDLVSIVLYETGVEVFLEPQRIEDKRALLNRIDGIVTAGSTNLEGGIRKGFDLAKKGKRMSEGEVTSRVLLLSDGLANVGITNSEQLSGITREHFEKDRVSFSTFGVGTDYNEDLMAKIAMQAGGKYYFIASPEKLSAMFDEELKGMSQVVAKNTTLKIRFPEDQLSYDKTYAYNSNRRGSELELSFNDIFAEEQKAILIRFKAKNKIKTPVVIECVLSYDNANNDTIVKATDTRRSEINTAKDEKEFRSGYNKAASEGYALQVTGEMYDEAVQASNNGKYEDAKKKVKEAKGILDSHFKNIGDNPFLKDVYNKMKEYEDIIDDMKNMDHETVRYNIKLYKQRSFRTISCPKF